MPQRHVPGQGVLRQQVSEVRDRLSCPGSSSNGWSNLSLWLQPSRERVLQPHRESMPLLWWRHPSAFTLWPLLLWWWFALLFVGRVLRWRLKKLSPEKKKKKKKDANPEMLYRWKAKKKINRSLTRSNVFAWEVITVALRFFLWRMANNFSAHIEISPVTRTADNHCCIIVRNAKWEDYLTGSSQVRPLLDDPSGMASFPHSSLHEQSTAQCSVYGIYTLSFRHPHTITQCHFPSTPSLCHIFCLSLSPYFVVLPFSGFFEHGILLPQLNSARWEVSKVQIHWYDLPSSRNEKIA